MDTEHAWLGANDWKKDSYKTFVLNFYANSSVATFCHCISRYELFSAYERHFQETCKYQRLYAYGTVAQPGICFGGGSVTNVVRVPSLVILHNDHFDVTDQFPICYNRIWRQISFSNIFGGHGFFDLILAALASKIRGAISAKFGSQVPTGSLLQERWSIHYFTTLLWQNNVREKSPIFFRTVQNDCE